MLVGVTLLLLGRRLFWLLVGVVGFTFGYEYGAQIWAGASEAMRFPIALVAGIAGAVLAYFFQALMVAVAGFLAGAQLAVVLFNALHPIPDHDFWLLSFLAGGVIGAALLVAVFDSAVLLLSSLFGASLVVQSVNAAPYQKLVLFAVLLLVGIVVQSNLPRARPVRRL
ncbi:MAG TPA: DUF4203 domain-containing protein [Candidatus Margulisiibacteriota bacterium]|nr:DUF4203 domain-containing protein [Candidatus Margulisiibacteriota bacterium]